MRGAVAVTFAKAGCASLAGGGSPDMALDSGNLVREVFTTSCVEFMYREEAFDVRSHGEFFRVDSELLRQRDGHRLLTADVSYTVYV